MVNSLRCKECDGSAYFMSGKSSCKIGHDTHLRRDMVQQTVYVNTGSSVGGSFNPSRKKSTRVSARQYQRKTQRYVCRGCWATRPNYFRVLFLTLVIGPLFIPYYTGYSKFRGTLFILTFGVFGIGWAIGIIMAMFASLENYNHLPNSRFI